MAKKKPDDFKKFWSEFGLVLKEGPAEDFANREKIRLPCRQTRALRDARTGQGIRPAPVARQQRYRGREAAGTIFGAKPAQPRRWVSKKASVRRHDSVAASSS